MKIQIINVAAILIICLTLMGCGLLSSEDKRTIEIELDSQILGEQNTITARVHNHTSDVIKIFQNNLHSQLQRKNSNDGWVRLFSRPIKEGEGIPYSDWYINLKPDEYIEFELNTDLITGLSEINSHTVSGEYRFIFEIVLNYDYQNIKEFFSRSFLVEVK